MMPTEKKALQKPEWVRLERGRLGHLEITAYGERRLICRTRTYKVEDRYPKQPKHLFICFRCYDYARRVMLLPDG